MTFIQKQEYNEFDKVAWSTQFVFFSLSSFVKELNKYGQYAGIQPSISVRQESSVNQNRQKHRRYLETASRVITFTR